MILKEKSLLLDGKRGLSMLSDALGFCRTYLGKENPDTHPDFLYVSPADGRKTMGVEEAGLVEARASLRPSVAGRQVIIIDGIDQMTEQGQNKLLKTLEDCEAVIFAISYGGNVLDTVRSRLEPVYYRPLDRAEFIKETGFAEKDAELLFHASQGCPALAERLQQYVPQFERIVTSVGSGCLPELLPAMSLLVEKDKASVSTSPDRIYFINFLLRVFEEQMEYRMTGHLPEHPVTAGCNSYTPEQLVKIMKLLMEHQRICQRVSYSKDNFFRMTVGIIESK